ncbi:MAG: ABC transporter ATP-binding protein [Clostridia bacterium]|nr:ABC transporter ATP-binding protein [Clostridia bacterium]HXK72677.1 ABC transporter ATP-binding protein [Clostridia bacterium]
MGYIWQYKFLLFLALAMTLAANLLSLAGPFLSGKAISAIENGFGKVDFDTVFFYAGLMLGFFAISAILSYLLTIVMVNISRNITYKMRKDVFDKITKLPVGFFDTNQTGDILSRISYDIDVINTSLSNDVVHILAGITTVIGALIMMLVISPIMTLVFAITVPLAIVVTKKKTKKTRPLFRKRSAKIGELNGFTEEMISGQKTLKAYLREIHTIQKYDENNDETVEVTYDAEYHGSTIGPTVNFINNLSLSLISVFGAAMYLLGGITIANISSFVLYSRKFAGPINETANIIAELQSALSAAERVFRLLDEDEEKADEIDAVSLDNPYGDIEINDVNFSYVENVPIIQNLSLKAPKGTLVAIVGPTGAGKTTLINLLMRFYDADSGSISLDGYKINNITRKDLRLAYSMVLQDTWLFHGTVYENVTYGRQDATMEEVVAACKAANIHNYIENLPDGYQTMINDDGTNISKGQKQLLTIARAMLMNTSLLILDEATSNVDTRTELNIQQAMRTLMSDKTCFIIAHRLSTIQNADHILVVNSGQIIEQGTHKELIELKGFYADLFYSQFS